MSDAIWRGANTTFDAVWLNFTEAVGYSRLNHHIVRRLLYDGELVGRKVGRRWIVSRKSIDDYLSEPAREVRVAVRGRR